MSKKAAQEVARRHAKAIHATLTKRQKARAALAEKQTEVELRNLHDVEMEYEQLRAGPEAHTHAIHDASDIVIEPEEAEDG